MRGGFTTEDIEGTEVFPFTLDEALSGRVAPSWEAVIPQSMGGF